MEENKIKSICGRIGHGWWRGSSWREEDHVSLGVGGKVSWMRAELPTCALKDRRIYFSHLHFFENCVSWKWLPKARPHPFLGHLIFNDWLTRNGKVQLQSFNPNNSDGHPSSRTLCWVGWDLVVMTSQPNFSLCSISIASISTQVLLLTASPNKLPEC